MHDDSSYGLCRCGCGERTKIAPQTRRDRGHVQGEPLPYVAGHMQRKAKRTWPAGVPRYCECGCGQMTPVAKRTKLAQGHVAGEPVRFVHGHNTRKPIVRTTNGYPHVRIADSHPFAEMRDSGGYVLLHRLRMAQHLGRPLTRKEVVHHIDEDRMNFALENLQLFSSNAEHTRHHKRKPK